MKEQFKYIKHALEEHLNAINENSTEIQVLFDYLQDVESKVDQLTQRLDNLEIQKSMQKPSITPLNRTEKKVFVTLYTEEEPLSYIEIAKRAQLPLSIVPDSVSSLHRKGIPFIRSFCNNQLLFKIAPSFKELQAKENIINLSLNSFLE